MFIHIQGQCMFIHVQKKAVYVHTCACTGAVYVHTCAGYIYMCTMHIRTVFQVKSPKMNPFRLHARRLDSYIPVHVLS